VSTKLDARAREMVEHAMGESWAQKKPLEELLAAAMVTLAREHAADAMRAYMQYVPFDIREDAVKQALRAAEEQE
jgi:hypothetical protein